MNIANIERTCVICKSEFLTRFQKQVYCSYDCYSTACRTRSSAYYTALKKAKLSISKICPECHNHFETLKRRVLYCSEACSTSAKKEKCRAYMQTLRDQYKEQHPKNYEVECVLCFNVFSYKTKQGKYCDECVPIARKIARGQGPLNVPKVFKDLPIGETLAATSAALEFKCWLCGQPSAGEKDLCQKCEQEQAA